MLGVVPPGNVVFETVEHDDRNALPVSGRERLETHETRHVSCTGFHPGSGLAVPELFRFRPETGTEDCDDRAAAGGLHVTSLHGPESYVP